jgi:hypothetical protein
MEGRGQGAQEEAQDLKEDVTAYEERVDFEGMGGMGWQGQGLSSQVQNI